MHWYEGGKFYRVSLSMEFRTGVQIFDEDTQIAPDRAAAIKRIVAAWEKEWLEGSAITSDDGS
jgi:hypothetical protein